MSRTVLWPLALLPLGFFIAVAGFLLRERVAAGRGMPAFSIWCDDRDGLAEAAHFLAELGWEPVAVTRPINALRDHGLLIIAEPHAGGSEDENGGITENEAKGILRWVAAGNTLLFCSRHETALHEALQVSLSSDGREGGGALVTAAPDEAGGYTGRVDKLSVRDGTTLHCDEGLTLWPIRDRAGALFLRYGAGRILIAADPTMLTRPGTIAGG